MQNQTQTQKSIWNVPNILSLLRVVMVPGFVAVLLYTAYDSVVGCLVGGALFGLTAFTDMLDGKIARRCGLVTDFGKFIDPLADKFMVFAALAALIYRYRVVAEGYVTTIFVWVAVVVMLRELGVTSLRLVAAGKSGIVIAASWWGKIKTVTQILSIELLILEPLFGFAVFTEYHVAAYVAMAAMLITTVGSGIDYLRAYWPLLSGRPAPEK